MGTGDGATHVMAEQHQDSGLQETKLTGGIHTRRSLGNPLCVTEADSQHRGVVAITYMDAEGCRVEVLWSFGPNVVIFIIMLGRKSWYGVKAHVRGFTEI